MGDRFNKGKPKFGLIPLSELQGVAKVFEYGTKKYGKDNFKKGLFTDGIYESLLRHVIAMQKEERDSESGLLHLDHAICNLLMIRWMSSNKPEFHNLYTEGNVELSMNIPLYYSEDSDIYGAAYYVSAMTERLKGKSTEDSETFRIAQWIQNYKNYGTNSHLVKSLVKSLCKYLSCDLVIPIPSSLPEKNQMQHDFGDLFFRRIREVPKAKYNQSGVKNGFGKREFDESTLEIDTVALQSESPRKIMLIDDIAKTGTTINGCRDMFKSLGYDVECVVLGLSYKMIPHKYSLDLFKKSKRENKTLAKNRKLSLIKEEFESDLGISIDDVRYGKDEAEKRDLYHLDGNRISCGSIDVDGFSWDLKSKAIQSFDENEDISAILDGVPMPDFVSMFRLVIEGRNE